MIGKFLHVGIEVGDLDQSIALYEKLGFSLTKRFEKPDPKAEAAHVKNPDGVTLELWQFFDKSHPQVEFIRRHIAIESDSLDEDVKSLVEQGYEVVIPKTKGVTLTYSFVKDLDGNYIEVAQR